MEEDLKTYRADKRNRLYGNTDDIFALNDEEDMMIALLEILSETELVPTVGKYYTFVYTAKTPDIQYDQHPLIACVDIFKWGFRGINYHWRDFRNYTWEEVQGQLHVIYPNELQDARSIPYQKFLNT